MKSMKRLTALFMAMVMALSLMAMTAAAYGEDEHVHDETCCEETSIQPRKPAAICPACGKQMTELKTYHDESGQYYTDVQCNTNGCPAWHIPVTLKW